LEKEILFSHYLKAAKHYYDKKNSDKILDIQNIAQAFLATEIKQKYSAELLKIKSYINSCHRDFPKETKIKAVFDHEKKKIAIYQGVNYLFSLEKPKLKSLLKDEINLDNVEPLICFLGWKNNKAIFNAFVVSQLKKVKTSQTL
jgi:hypothetical protein